MFILSAEGPNRGHERVSGQVVDSDQKGHSIFFFFKYADFVIIFLNFPAILFYSPGRGAFVYPWGSVITLTSGREEVVQIDVWVECMDGVDGREPKMYMPLFFVSIHF